MTDSTDLPLTPKGLRKLISARLRISKTRNGDFWRLAVLYADLLGVRKKKTEAGRPPHEPSHSKLVAQLHKEANS